MSLKVLFSILKGGPGSGNIGHKGIPGHRGGSALSSSEVSYQDYQKMSNTQRNEFATIKKLPKGIEPETEEFFDYLANSKLDTSILRSYSWLSGPINSSLRNNKPLSEKNSENIKEIDALFNHPGARAKTNLTVYRGIPKEYLKDEFTDKGYTSTSASRGYAESFGGGNIIKIVIPKGSKIVVNPESFEQEILLPRNSKFKKISENTYKLIK